jgi:hypothetical protein
MISNRTTAVLIIFGTANNKENQLYLSI